MWVKKEVYNKHTVTDMQTHRQTDNGGGGIQVEKKITLTSYPFGTPFAKHM